MRILVDIGEKQLQALDALSKRGKRSRASLIRDAVGDYLARRQRPEAADAFGLWGERIVDGQAYQEKLRAEW
jgi:metal-responsive CopG/Arc/MetJ family transcriptional regulator